ncbi:disulfide bond formation protein DsbB [Wolbachia pipientis]|uniref:Disulfide bond formation protein DsbB n=1 Tax=Wolbachia pipientis TaxID=955 RepID=A0A1E7QJX4_WOLPI|nr:disulfide bond formation protein DsbB [Wolbachia pipientis]
MLNNSKITSTVFLLSSTVALIFAYILQYFFNILPCKLCIYERIVFYVVAVLSVLCLIKEYKALIYIMFCSYLIGIIISFYHIGIEAGWFQDIIGCTEQINNNITIEELRNSLLNTHRLPSCDRGYYVLGLSLATWNLLYLLIILLISVRIYFRGRRKEIT